MVSNSNHEATPLITNVLAKPSNINDYQSTAPASKDCSNATEITNISDQRKTKRKPCYHHCVQRWRKLTKRLATCIDWTYIGNKSFDSINIVITIADIVTDILVIYDFYQKNEMTFFWIGLTIIIFAQVCYAIAFWVEYVDKDNYMRAFCWFIIALIFSPLMSFVFFFTSHEEQWLSRAFIRRMPGLLLPRSHFKHPKENTGLITEWVESKFNKHFGFIVESVCEAFPQVE